MKAIGWVFVVLVVLGWCNLIDFHVCAGPTGYCNPQLTRGK